MRKIHFADHLEEQIAYALDNVGIAFTHESENKEQGLDFYLPEYDVYIEVKQYHADRIAAQMKTQDNVIAIQGKAALNFFVNLLR